MRIPGIGGRVLEKAGGTAVLSAGGEIFTNLERGVIDATEWIGPYHDYKMGFQNITKYYYYPGWHEPGTILETIINKDKLATLPEDLQLILEAAAAKQYIWTLSEFEAKNNEYLDKIKSESNVEFRKFPTEVLEKLKSYAKETMQEICDGDQEAATIYKSFTRFKETMNKWANLTEAPFYNDLK
jgi:TRAP-type mannitol/chloroaromatic compound transport system substrate-binding protein